jgi:hypothetical protein
MRYRSGRVEVEIHDVIDAIRDEDLLEECRARKLLAKEGEQVRFSDVEDAYDYLRDGDAAEALLILERILRPKWASVAKAEEAMERARQ